jgi:hypothetical protein
LMALCSKAATVSATCQPDTIPYMGVMWQSDMTWRSSNHQQHHWLLLASEPL